MPEYISDGFRIESRRISDCGYVEIWLLRHPGVEILVFKIDLDSFVQPTTLREYTAAEWHGICSVISQVLSLKGD